ncbi:MAG: MarR family winged helix-turn-helix transcriptional regulator [Spirochaetaceae bacterium]|jgi:DNA-binding MarR family transcriptional regulator|nr:MarR family winged helix-turn-helix transcriptional regulator [Spirochaetaceae bacterium]
MNDDLKKDLLHALFYFKKAVGAISRFLANAGGGGLSIAELSALKHIGNCDKNDCGTAGDSHPANQTTHHAMHETLAVSKAAISQMLGSLEKRAYIRRGIDRENRRKIIVTVTKKGKTAVNRGEKDMDALTSRIIDRFGEDDTRNFVRLLIRFAEIADQETARPD